MGKCLYSGHTCVIVYGQIWGGFLPNCLDPATSAPTNLPILDDSHQSTRREAPSKRSSGIPAEQQSCREVCRGGGAFQPCSRPQPWQSPCLQGEAQRGASSVLPRSPAVRSAPRATATPRPQTRALENPSL